MIGTSCWLAALKYARRAADAYESLAPSIRGVAHIDVGCAEKLTPTLAFLVTPTVCSFVESDRDQQPGAKRRVVQFDRTAPIA
jgi:hypothetical protein